MKNTKLRAPQNPRVQRQQIVEEGADVRVADREDEIEQGGIALGLAGIGQGRGVGRIATAVIEHVRMLHRRGQEHDGW